MLQGFDAVGEKRSMVVVSRKFLMLKPFLLKSNNEANSGRKKNNVNGDDDNSKKNTLKPANTLQTRCRIKPKAPPLRPSLSK